MATQREIKRRIRASKGIASVARALQVISANKVRRAQKLNENNRRYLESLAGLNSDPARPPARQGSDDLRSGIFIVFVPERGLCGPLLNKITVRFLDLVKINPQAEYVFVGHKGKKMAKFLKNGALAFFEFGSGQPTFSKTLSLSKLITEKLIKDPQIQLYGLYTKFINFQDLSVNLDKIYPLSFEKSIEDKFKLDVAKEDLLQSLEIIFMKSSIYQKFLEAYMSENAARLTAMTQASQNARELSRELTHVLNQERQKAITTEILELKGGVVND